MRKRVVYSLLVHLGCTSLLLAQDFRNLDFEDANVPDLPVNQSGWASVTDALPSWTAYIGTNIQTSVAHNGVTLGNANVGVLGPDYLSPAFGPEIRALEGLYTAVLQDGGTPNQGAQPASIAQTGLIPSWAKSVQFEGTLQLGGPTFKDNLAVMVGGQNEAIVPLGNNFYTCDVSAFAGLEEELRFTMVTNYGHALILLDAITFSPTAIPEPSALCLLILGIAGLICWPRTRRRTT